MYTFLIQNTIQNSLTLIKSVLLLIILKLVALRTHRLLSRSPRVIIPDAAFSRVSLVHRKSRDTTIKEMGYVCQFFRTRSARRQQVNFIIKYYYAAREESKTIRLSPLIDFARRYISRFRSIMRAVHRRAARIRVLRALVSFPVVCSIPIVFL